MSYQIRPLRRVCSESGEPLAPGSTCYSALVMIEGELKRLDISADHWNGPPDDVVGWWKAEVPEDRQTRRPLDPDDLMTTLEQLDEEASPSSERLRYVIGLQLLSKRRVELESIRRDDDGDTWLRLLGSRSEGPFEVRDFGLSDEDIQQILDQYRRTG